MKTEQENEVKALKDRINYLENLLKIEKNEKKSNDNDFKGTIVKIKLLFTLELNCNLCWFSNLFNLSFTSLLISFIYSFIKYSSLLLSKVVW